MGKLQFVRSHRNIFIFIICLCLIQCSSDSNNNETPSTTPEETLSKLQLSSGASHSCLSADKFTKPYCWGSGSNGKLGSGATDNSISPKLWVESLDFDEGVASLAASMDHTCYVSEDEGQLACVGSGDSGRLGDGQTSTDTGSTEAVVVVKAPGSTEPITGVQDISSKGDHTCITALPEGATDEQATIAKCWGINDDGQLGDGTNTERLAPVDVQDSNGDVLANVVQISAGINHSCGVVGIDRRAFCWGDNNSGQLGNGTTTPSTFATPVLDTVGGDPLTGVAEVQVGHSFTCARLEIDGSTWCWGAGPRLGNNGLVGQPDSLIPTRVILNVTDEDGTSTTSNLDGATSLTTGHFHTCVTLSDQRGACWGENNGGSAIGNNDASPYQGVATFIHTASGDTTPLEGIVSLSAGHNFTCGVIDENLGALKCWGNGTNNIIGDGRVPEDHSLAPVDIIDENGEPFTIL